MSKETLINAQERAQVKVLCEAVQKVTGQTVKVVWADQGYSGQSAKDAAASHGIDLQIIKLMLTAANKAASGVWTDGWGVETMLIGELGKVCITHRPPCLLGRRRTLRA